MPDGRDVSYVYDGSFEGLLCCIFRSVRMRENPLSVAAIGEGQLTLFGAENIETDFSQADTVKDAIEKKISFDALEFINLAFYTQLKDKDTYILRYIKKAFRVAKNGGNIANMLTDPDVKTLTDAVRHLTGESHLLKGFIRFSDYGGVLVSVIEPKNRVLYVICEHFCDRFNMENFIIYDKTHREALIYRDGAFDVIPSDKINLPAPDERETKYRVLWKRFYNTIGIRERFNPICRRGHMPMRYWQNMTEFLDDSCLFPEERQIENAEKIGKKLPNGGERAMLR